MVKPFLTNKSFLKNETIAIENKGKIVTDKSELVNLFNSYYVNIVEKMSGCPPEIEGNPEIKLMSQQLYNLFGNTKHSPVF